MNDEDYMAIALQLACRAESTGEVPVGALLVVGGEIVGRGWNQPIGSCDPSAHAEIVALRAAARVTKNYRLPGTTLFVTLEPCVMCVGAMIHARVERLVYGAHEPRSGAVVSAFSLLDSKKHNHDIRVSSGILAAECISVMREFFSKRR
jgi:tRNA(adenine34) deaminase